MLFTLYQIEWAANPDLISALAGYQVGELSIKFKGAMKLNQLAQQSGYSVSTIYDYLKSGLLHQPIKKGPTRSFFDQTHLDRLNRIRLLKKENVSLSEIRKMIAGQEEGGKEDSNVKQQIVDKALELFSKRHYENTKITDIASALNMGSGTFYRYFKSKEELFLECLERLPEVLVPREAWEEVMNETDFFERLKKRGYAMFNAFPSYTGILDYAKLSLGSENRNLAQKAAECLESLIAPIRRDLKQFMAEGLVREGDEELIAYLLVGINETFFHRMLIDSTYTIEQGFSIIEDFVRHALGTRSSEPSFVVSDARLYQLTDLQGNVMKLEALSFNGEPFLRGGFWEGVLKVSLEDILEIGFIKEDEKVRADLSVVSGSRVSLSLKPTDQLSGRSDLGEFEIPVVHIASLKQLV